MQTSQLPSNSSVATQQQSVRRRRLNSMPNTEIDRRDSGGEPSSEQPCSSGSVQQHAIPHRSSLPAMINPGSYTNYTATFPLLPVYKLTYGYLTVVRASYMQVLWWKAGVHIHECMPACSWLQDRSQLYHIPVLEGLEFKILKGSRDFNKETSATTCMWTAIAITHQTCACMWLLKHNCMQLGSYSYIHAQN